MLKLRGMRVGEWIVAQVIEQTQDVYERLRRSAYTTGGGYRIESQAFPYYSAKRMYVRGRDKSKDDCPWLIVPLSEWEGLKQAVREFNLSLPWPAPSPSAEPRIEWEEVS